MASSRNRGRIPERRAFGGTPDAVKAARPVWGRGKAGAAGARAYLWPLFATIFYRDCRDIVRLADVMGHSSIETTRIYLVTSGTDHQRQMERLGLMT